MFHPRSVAPATDLDQLRAIHDLSAFIHAREGEALSRLAAATGGQSLCAPSRGAGPVRGAKYLEGMAAAFAEARRSIGRLPASHGGGCGSCRALIDIHDRWIAQSAGRGRAGPNWAEYLSGGRSASGELAEWCETFIPLGV